MENSVSKSVDNLSMREHSINSRSAIVKKKIYGIGLTDNLSRFSKVIKYYIKT